MDALISLVKLGARLVFDAFDREDGIDCELAIILELFNCSICCREVTLD
jgi:hypothetical protein